MQWLKEGLKKTLTDVLLEGCLIDLDFHFSDKRTDGCQNRGKTALGVERTALGEDEGRKREGGENGWMVVNATKRAYKQNKSVFDRPKDDDNQLSRNQPQYYEVHFVSQ